MPGFPEVSASDYLDTAIRNASNRVVTGKRGIERRANEQRQPLSASHERYEKAVDAALGEFIPAHEVYNDMRIAALQAIVDNRLYKADPVANRAQLDQVAQAIQAKQPKFRNPGKEQTVEPGLIAGLYRQVKDIPASALLGHRWEETGLDGNMSGSVRGHDSAEALRADRISNAILPSSPYYNDLRQKFFDLVRTKGAAVRSKLQEDARIREEMRKPGAPDFIANKFFHPSNEAMAEFNRLLLPHKKAFQAEVPPSKPVSPEALVRIGSLMVAHHRTWVPIQVAQPDGQPAAKIPRVNLRDSATSVPDRIPDGIAQAVRHFEPDIAADRPKAIELRKRLIEQVDAVLPPNTSNFGKRQQLGRMVFDKRETLLGAATVEEGYRKVFGNPALEKNKVTAQHQQTIRDMAENCERFAAAFEGRDPGFGLDAEAAGPAAPVKRLGKQRMTANLNGLKKAGADEQQLKIATYFTSLKRSHAEMSGQTAQPPAKAQGQAKAADALNLNRSPELDPRVRDDGRGTPG